MRTTKQKEVIVCDGCKQDIDYAHECIGCKKEYCYECQKSNGQEMKYSVYCSGSGDIYICNKCLTNQKNWSVALRTLYRCYLRIAALRVEATEKHKEFQERIESAEKKAKKALEAMSQ